MYVIISGICGVFVRIRDGLEVQVGQIGPGATIAEVSLFEGQAEHVTVAPATLRALTDLEVVNAAFPWLRDSRALFRHGQVACSGCRTRGAGEADGTF